MSIYPDKKDGKLTGRFRVEVQGHYVPYRARCDSIGEARQKEAEFKALIDAGLPPPPPSTSVGGRPRKMPLEGPQTALYAVPGAPVLPTSKMLQEALQEVEGTTRIWDKDKQRKQSESSVRVMLELMGDVELNAIDTVWVQDVRERIKETRTGKKGEPVSDTTINRYLAALGAFLNYTIKKGWRTVATLPDMEYSDEDNGRIYVITPEEEATLYRLMNERCAKLAGISIRTGGRRGELLKLAGHPERVRNGNVTFPGGTTKSGKARTVPLAPGDEETLLWLINGNMPTEDELTDEWKKPRAALGKLEEPAFVFHACRHTYATRAIDGGVHPRVLQTLMGHATFKMTERYTHINDDMITQAGEKMFGRKAA